MIKMIPPSNSSRWTKRRVYGKAFYRLACLHFGNLPLNGGHDHGLCEHGGPALPWSGERGAFIRLCENVFLWPLPRAAWIE
jgi:hypothetical protein